MARRHPPTCRLCGRSKEETGHISATGLCPEHSLSEEIANIEALRSKTGPQYAHWARRLHMATRRALVALDQDAA